MLIEACPEAVKVKTGSGDTPPRPLQVCMHVCVLTFVFMLTTSGIQKAARDRKGFERQV